jgi:hypothetical protein
VPKRKAVIGEWRKFRIEKLQHLCTPPDFVQKIKKRSNQRDEICSA